VLGVFTTLPAGAWEVSSAYSLGGQYSDNIGLVPDNEEEAWVGLAMARYGIRERSGNLDLDAMAQLEYRDYQTDLLDDELLFSLDANAVWTLAPGRRFWHFEDYYRQADSDPLEPPTPENREDTNVLSTGPEFRWRLSPYRTAIAGARYGYFWFEEDDVDSQRLSAYARLVHDWRARTQLSVNGEVTTVGYVEEVHSDYNRGDVYARAEQTLARGVLQVDLGGTHIQRDEDDDVSGILGRVALNLDVNSYSTLDSALIYQYTDVGHDILTTASRDGAVGVLDEQVTGDLYYIRHGELAYEWHGVRASLRVVGVLREEDYEDDPADRTVQEVHGHVGYRLSDTLSLALSAIHVRQDFRENDVDITERHLGGGLHYRINSRLRAALEGGTTEQDSNDPSIEYRENVWLISLTYERTPFLE